MTPTSAFVAAAASSSALVVRSAAAASHSRSTARADPSASATSTRPAQPGPPTLSATSGRSSSTSTAPDCRRPDACLTPTRPSLSPRSTATAAAVACQPKPGADRQRPTSSGRSALRRATAAVLRPVGYAPDDGWAFAGAGRRRALDRRPAGQDPQQASVARGEIRRLERNPGEMAKPPNNGSTSAWRRHQTQVSLRPAGQPGSHDRRPRGRPGRSRLPDPRPTGSTTSRSRLSANVGSSVPR